MFSHLVGRSSPPSGVLGWEILHSKCPAPQVCLHLTLAGHLGGPETALIPNLDFLKRNPTHLACLVETFRTRVYTVIIRRQIARGANRISIIHFASMWAQSRIGAVSCLPKTCYKAQETGLQVSTPRIVGMPRRLAEEGSSQGGQSLISSQT